MRLAALCAVTVLLLASVLLLPDPSAAAGGSAVVVVGDRAEMKSRSALRVLFGPYHSDPSSVGILDPVYARAIIADPMTGELRPYVAKGIDADGSGTFDGDEYGVFAKKPGTNATDITVYFDFNGVRWHDGTQMTVMDLMFTYLIASLSPNYSPGMRVLWDRTGAPASNFTWSRWLAVDIAQKSWANEAGLPGDAALRSAVRFRLQAPFARFYETVLGSVPILPRHVWELTGGGRHADWGRAIYPEGDPRAGQGVPVNETLYSPLNYPAAESWEPLDADVIGSGPFRFTTWQQGGFAQLDRYGAYYVGRDPANPAILYDARLAGTLHAPFVDRFVFKVYRTVQLAVLALQSDEIQYYQGLITPEFVPDLLNSPGIRVWANAGLGFAYLAYNMRRLPFGYSVYPPADSVRDDAGLRFRLAVSHLIDTRSLLRGAISGFGTLANSPISPANLFWNNGTIPFASYDPALARTILDNAGWTDPPGDCQLDGMGCRSLPGIGTGVIEILTPHSDYDRFQASAGTMITSAARSVGVNLVSKPTALGAIFDAVAARNFSMFILNWRIEDPDPDFLFAAYDCAESPNGPNYPGYCDSEFDRIIERSRSEMNLNERQRLIKWAQGVLMADRPVEPLYFPDVIEATRQDRFVNWSVSIGTLWNYWSWIGVKPAAVLQPIQVTPRYYSAMASETRQRIEATVKDLAGHPLAGATVTFRILPQAGGRFVESGSPEITGTTGAAGTFGATYESPLTLGDPRDIAIEIVASHPDASAPVQRGIVVTVFPGMARFLSLRVSLPAGDIGLPDTPLPLRLDVTDEVQSAVRDAIVTASVSPANASLSRTNGSSSEMASLVFAPPPDLRSTLWYRISIEAAKPGYYSAFANASILIIYRPEVLPPPPAAFPPGVETWLLALAVAAVAFGALALLWRAVLRRRRLPRG